ncbi:Transcription factor Spi-C [Trichinella spiralis]|uniref:Transcription factor Spi-C n=1 Tax=Trichinella spiralis TaxID=6334 RepID=A0ABR3KDV4_TRISP
MCKLGEFWSLKSIATLNLKNCFHFNVTVEILTISFADIKFQRIDFINYIGKKLLFPHFDAEANESVNLILMGM